MQIEMAIARYLGKERVLPRRRVNKVSRHGRLVLSKNKRRCPRVVVPAPQCRNKVGGNGWQERNRGGDRHHCRGYGCYESEC